ncbi:MAG: DNA translocase FtsK, partial [Bacilli bacterium]
LSFAVVSAIDSRTVLDGNGAEQLLGKGDMLFLENGKNKPVRIQGCYVTDEEIDAVVSWTKNHYNTSYLLEVEELHILPNSDDDMDELFIQACEYALEQEGISTSSLQRKLRIGFNRASRIIEMMEERGFVSEQRGGKAREVLFTMDDVREMQTVHE